MHAEPTTPAPRHRAAMRLMNRDGAAMDVLLVDDHPLIRTGMAALLSRIRPQLTLHLAADCATGLAIAGAHPIGLILLDLHLPDARGFEAIERFQVASPTARIVVLSGQNDPDTGARAVAHGAAGFIPKRLSPPDLEAALSSALNGLDVPQSTGDVPAPARQPAPIPALDPIGLTPRQRDVLRGLVHGLSNREIAEQLGLSEATVKTHLAAVMRACDASSRTQVIGWLARNGVALDRL